MPITDIQHSFDNQVAAEIRNQRSMIQPPDVNAEIKALWEQITESMAITRVNNAWSDIRSDTTCTTRSKLEMFLNGIKYAKDGVLPPEYANVIWRNKNDPEYAKYLELKQKFDPTSK